MKAIIPCSAVARAKPAIRSVSGEVPVKQAGLIGGALALAVAASPAAAQDPAAVMLEQPAPAFSLSEVRSGETHALEDFRGRYVVLHFGASW
jgi:hypothetical protein